MSVHQSTNTHTHRTAPRPHFPVPGHLLHASDIAQIQIRLKHWSVVAHTTAAPPPRPHALLPAPPTPIPARRDQHDQSPARHAQTAASSLSLLVTGPRQNPDTIGVLYFSFFFVVKYRRTLSGWSGLRPHAGENRRVAVVATPERS